MRPVNHRTIHSNWVGCANSQLLSIWRQTPQPADSYSCVAHPRLSAAPLLNGSLRALPGEGARLSKLAAKR